MGQSGNLNAVNNFKKGDFIYKEGEDLTSIALLIKGRIQVQHAGACYLIGPGMFLAVSDVYHGKYQSSYIAYEDAAVYLFGIDHKEDLENILSYKKDYSGYVIMSLNRVISELGKIYRDMTNQCLELYDFLTEGLKVYNKLASMPGYTAKKPEWINELGEVDPYMLDMDKLNYYIESASIPAEIVKAYYSSNSAVTMYQMGDQADLINQLNELLKEYARKLLTMTEYIISDNGTCLFNLAASCAREIINKNGSCGELIDVMDGAIEQINKTENFFINSLGRKLKIDRNIMEKAYHLVMNSIKDLDARREANRPYSAEEAEKVLEELKGSFKKILDYAEIDEKTAKKMLDTMNDFISLADRLSLDEKARKIRRALTDEFYELYKHVFLKAYRDENVPRLIDMFLKYGYADERLLDREQRLALYFLKEENVSSDIKVYNIKEWLTLIYEGKKEPSKNEFDQEYKEMLVSLKSKGKLTDSQLAEYASDMEKRLEYEINNMFRYNNRTTNGQISVFVPVLHKDMISGHLDRAYVTPAVINDAFARLLEIDYSVFDREILYVNKEKKIEKEYIIERIYPDIILMPNMGSNGIMWQDITGKRRNSPGRFLFPIFSAADLFQNVVKVCGRFRWEICRTIEGTAWNDIKVKSLTSEYTDYIQFYKKNRELSEERKEKLKLQIQKGRNNSREIFVIDYEAWINYESKGAIKLNKVVREIMATYCPFSKNIRDQLIIQPIFEEAFARFIRNRLKKIRETEGRHRMLQKDNIEITREMEDTLRYYKET